LGQVNDTPTNVSEHSYQHQKKIYVPGTANFTPGFAVITFSNFSLASKAFKELDETTMTERKCRVTTGLKSPRMNDPLKYALKDKTCVVHLANLPWFTNAWKLKEWIVSNGIQFAENNKHKQVTDDTATRNPENQSAEDQFVNENESNKEEEKEVTAVNPCPIKIFIKFRDGFPVGRANATLANPKQATQVVLSMNGKRFGSRKIQINWAVPLHDEKLAAKKEKNVNIKDCKEEPCKESEQVSNATTDTPNKLENSPLSLKNKSKKRNKSEANLKNGPPTKRIRAE